MFLNRFILPQPALLIGLMFMTLLACAAPALGEVALVDVPAVADTAAAEVTGAEAAVEHGSPADAKKAGLPQFDTSTYASQIFWLTVSFVLLYVLMSRMALPRISEVMEMRQTQKDNNLSRAEQMHEEAEKIEATYQETLQKAREDAQERLTQAENKAAARLSEENARFLEHTRNRLTSAEQNIAKAKEEALHSLADISAEIAAEIALKIAGANVSKAEARKVVTEIMKEAA